MLISQRMSGKQAYQRMMLEIDVWFPLFSNPDHDAEVRLLYASPEGQSVITAQASGRVVVERVEVR